MIYRFIRLFLFLSVTVSFCFTLAAQIEFTYKSNYLSGYNKEVSGETLNYYTIGAQSFDALLVRSLDSKEYIEWQTEPIPENYDKDVLSFVMLASLQVNKDTHSFDIYLNNKKYFTLNNPVEKSLTPIKIKGTNNSELEFSHLEYDRFDDLTGFLFFHISANDFPKGEPINIKVVGQSSNSRTWFMIFKHSCKSTISLTGENIMLNNADSPRQSMRVKIMNMADPAIVKIKIGDMETQSGIRFGYNYFVAGAKRVKEPEKLPVEVQLDDKVIGSTEYLFKPVSPVTIYLLPHSHTDIGYTDIQENVQKTQWQHIEDAIELGNATINYPPGARFKWNTEVMWAPESYLAAATPEKRARFIDAVQKGIIGIDGIYANMLTGLCTPEEWVWMTDIVKKMNDECGKKIESAMICDVPGWTWSMTSVLANAGIKYLSFGINQGDRIGSIRQELGDKPFYWVSPSGKEKVLTWVHEQGYSAFHYVPKAGSQAGYSVIEPTIVNYVDKLAEDKYPYDIIPLHYTIGSDNGPTDKYLADNVKKWNETYYSPRLVIATTPDFFKDFESKYADKIPALSGDITPYWEDGAASSSKETALNKQTADKLTQALNLAAQYSAANVNTELFEKAWRNVILYDEHTWGSWNSISEPDIDFTIQQWKVKQAFAVNGAKQAEDIMRSVLSQLSGNAVKNNTVEVINTSSVPRTGLVTMPEAVANNLTDGLSLIDEKKNAVPIQRLTDNTIVFLADVPAFGNRRYTLGKPEQVQNINPVKISSNSLENEFLSLELDTVKGVITKLISKNNNVDLVNKSEKFGMGAYVYVNSRKPDNPETASAVKISIKEKGPLVSSFLVELKGPGCNSITEEIKLTAGANRIDLNYTLDKQKIYTPEAVRMAFPFNIPNAAVNVQNAIGYYQTEKEQIKGSCKNFFTMNNYADVSNQEYGVTFVSPDAPLIETGGLTNDAKILGWRDTCMPGSSIYSFLMNNYWHTNFCATQEGISSYRYQLYPHWKFDPAVAEANGSYPEQPLIAVATNDDANKFEPLLAYNNPAVSLVSILPINNGKALWTVFYNASANNTDIKLVLKNRPAGIYGSDLLKAKKENATESFSIPGKGIRCLYIEW